MAKRFTDTGKWIKASFRLLSLKLKCVWMYLVDNCDHAGVWDVDLELMSFQLGEKITKEEILSGLKDRIEILSETKWFIPAFVEFQYGELNPENKVHRSVLHRLEVVGATKGLGSPMETAKEKDKAKEKEKDTEKDKEKGKGGVGEKPKQRPCILTLWNTNCGTLPHAQSSSTKRNEAWRARWNERPDEAYWTGVVKRLAASSFCQGHGGRGWKANIDFLLRPETHIKASEGQYDGGNGTAPRRPLTREEAVSAANRELWAKVERGEA